MYTVNNLQVNRNARCLKKKTILKLVAGFAIVAVLASAPIGVVAHNNRIEEKQNESIVAYYGEDSIENKIIQYIDISEKLSKLNLESFDIDKILYEKHNISNELKSPDEIEDLIKEFKGINSYISSKDITKQSKNIDIVLNLAAQEKLVNSFVYNVGYSVANKNITDATKKYAAEVFNIEDPKNVEFKYFMDSGSAESNTTVINKTPNKYGFKGKETYNFDNQFEKKEEKKITSGVVFMNQTDVLNDKISEDNNKYNDDRNNIIKDALYSSVDLELEVKENNLYNEKLVNKMK